MRVLITQPYFSSCRHVQHDVERTAPCSIRICHFLPACVTKTTKRLYFAYLHDLSTSYSYVVLYTILPVEYST